jgi:IclR family transcriptional regulator, KDG regulon repressor
VIEAHKPSSGSVQKAFQILELLNASSRGWNISEMSRKLKIPKSTTHVLVSTLDQMGYIKRCQYSRRFQLSTKMFGLGQKSLVATPLPDLSLAHIRQLVQEVSLTAHVGILEKNQIVFIQKADGPGLIKFDTYIGKCSDLHCTALGKCLSAFLPEESIDALLKGYVFNRFTRKTISSRSGFLLELNNVRRNGFALDDEEEELGVRCIAVPIFTGRDVIAAVSVTGTLSQIRSEDIEKIAKAAKRTAARIAIAVNRVEG